MARRRSKKTANTSAVFRGQGDYDTSVLGLRKPMERLEAKIDHLEKKLVKNPLSKANAAATIGRTLGNFAGQGDLGELAGSTLAKFFGHGDYVVKSNSLMGTGATVVPKFDGPRGTRIIEREFVGDILSGSLDGSGAATVFTMDTYELNPTNSRLFPWLSRISPLYDQWEPNGIVLEFVSTSSEFNGTSQALGTLVMATDYDPYDSPFATKQEMENSDYACSTKPSMGLRHGLECDPKERLTPLLFTASVGAPLTSTSLGNFSVASKGCSVAGVTLGELWISYDITFYKKQMAGELLLPTLKASGTTDALLGYMTNPTIALSRQVTITQNVGVGSILNFNPVQPKERFMVEYYMFTNINSNDDCSSWTVVDATIVSAFTQAVSGTTELLCVWVIETTGVGARLLTDTRSISATVSNYRVLVSRVSDDCKALI